jgi:hypothetical protein
VRRNYSLKPGRFPSGIGFVVGIFFILIGVFGIIPFTSKISDSGLGLFPMLFGLLWTFVAVAITAFHGYNAFSKKGSSVMNVAISDDSPAERESSTPAERLKQLEQLKTDGLITQAEYVRKREEILKEL